MSSSASHPGDNEWTEVVLAFQAPDDGRIRIAPFLVGFGKGTGTVWFDDLKLEAFEPSRATAIITREFLQSGIELIGSPAPEGTAEALTVLARALDAVGLQRYRIGLGDASLYPSLLRGTDGEKVYETGNPNVGHGELAKEIPGGYHHETPAQPGTSLALTIDRDLQFEVQRYLSDDMRRVDADPNQSRPDRPHSW